MKLRIIHRVLFAVVLVSTAVFGTSSWLSGRAQERAVSAEIERHALILSDTIRNSTRQAMLLDEREMVHRIIERIGRQEGLDKIRVYNKSGTVIYSPDASLIGSSVDKHNEACDACHVESDPIERLPAGKRTREFVDSSGSRQLGVITPIENEAACSSAACHAHDPGQRVLGVLDVTVSLKEVDRAVARSGRIAAGFAIAAILVMSLLLWGIFHHLVDRPVGRLVTATKALAAGDLEHRIPVRRSDELGQLAESFNEMTVRLSDARHQVYQSNKLASLGRLAAGIAHEINNPLTGVLTYSSFLLNRATDPETKSDLETIVRETRRCRDIVRGLLDFSRQVPPKKSLVEIVPIVERALSIVDNQLRVQNIAVQRSLAPDLPRIAADPNQIQQVVINLLVNAADAVEGDDRRIAVSVDRVERAGKEGIEVRVEDSGSGIPERDLGKIFEPFFTTKGTRGTGLGLAVAWGIVAEHRGTIEVDSETGKGSVFRVFLPILDGGPSREEGS